MNAIALLNCCAPSIKERIQMMGKILSVTALMAYAECVLGQGRIIFNNRLTTAGAPGTVTEPFYAPIFGVNPANPEQILTGQGNMATPGGFPIPMGSTDYSGRPLLSGTGFTAQLWYGAVGTAPGELVLASSATSTFRTGTTTMGAFNGSIATLDNPATMIPGGPGTRAVFQVRAWDNLGGTVTAWADVMANPNIARGATPTFTPNFDLANDMDTLVPSLIGIKSFGLYTVPEPSFVALGVLGAGLLFFTRRTRL